MYIEEVEIENFRIFGDKEKYKKRNQGKSIKEIMQTVKSIR